MIDINSVYVRYNDLLLKGKGGYISGDEFNRSIRDTQSYLSEFYIEKIEGRIIPDTLSAFVTEVELPIASGYATLPSDYAHKRDWIMEIQDLTCVGNSVIYDQYEINELKSGEYSNLLRSPIRKPSITENKYSAELVMDQKIKVYPKETVGRVYLKYIKLPPVATWASTVDVPNDQENYDAGSSIDLIWDETDFNSILNIMLYLKGAQVRDSEIINWMSARTQIVESQ